MAKLLTSILVAVALVNMGHAAHPSEYNKEFCYNLYMNSAAEKGGNVFISPYSIGTGLSFLFMGAKGKTATEISNGVGLLDTDPPALAARVAPFLEPYKAEDSPITWANKLYVSSGYDVKADFEEVAKKSFDSETESLDFSVNVDAAKTMNDWVEKKTHNKIKNMIHANSLNGDTNMVLVNAVYFKGAWKTPFTKDLTQKTNFWTSELAKTEVDMMSVKGTFKYAKLPELNAVAVELPYATGNISMLVIVPNEKTGLPHLEEAMKDFSVYGITEKLAEAPLTVYMPKFKTEYETSLTTPLQKMGIKTLFTPAADFNNLLDTPGPLYLNEMVFKAFIEVDEEGTEVAETTATVDQLVTEELLVDRPFMYIIHMDTYPYFWGSKRQF